MFFVPVRCAGCVGMGLAATRSFGIALSYGLLLFGKNSFIQILKIIIMNLLNIFHTGGVTLGLTIVALGLSGWFMFQAGRAHKSGGIQQVIDGQKLDNIKTPYWKIPQFWGAVIVMLVWLLVMIFVVAPDYKGV